MDNGEKKEHDNTKYMRGCKVSDLTNGIFCVKKESQWLYTMYDAVLDALAGVRGVFGKAWIAYLFFCIVFDMARTGDVMKKVFENYEFNDFLVETAALFIGVGVGFLLLFFIIEMFEVALSKDYVGKVPMYDLSFTVVYLLIRIFGSAIVFIMGYKMFSILISLGYILSLSVVFFSVMLLFILAKKMLYHFRRGYIRKHLTEQEWEKVSEI